MRSTPYGIGGKDEEFSFKRTSKVKYISERNNYIALSMTKVIIFLHMSGFQNVGNCHNVQLLYMTSTGATKPVQYIVHIIYLPWDYNVLGESRLPQIYNVIA